MAEATKKSLGKYLKKYLIAGLLFWLPIAVTIWLVGYIIGAADRLNALIPQQWQPETYLGFNLPGQGFVIALIVLLATGIFAANVLGRKFLEAWDSLLGRIPIVKSIYSGAKKISESLFSDNGRSFKTPVLVPFPQSDIWTVAFVSGDVPQALRAALPDGGEYIAVYVPTTPNPTGGYYIMVRQSDIRVLDMSVDEALKYVISLGMVMPDDAQAQKQPAP